MRIKNSEVNRPPLTKFEIGDYVLTGFYTSVSASRSQWYKPAGWIGIGRIIGIRSVTATDFTRGWVYTLESCTHVACPDEYHSSNVRKITKAEVPLWKLKLPNLK